MRAVVIGAGIAGLSVARALKAKGHSVVVLEARATPGGRIRSVYEGDGATLAYESGPWRIPRSHTRALALFRAYGATLQPLAGAPPHTAPHSADNGGGVWPGLSTWEANALRTGPVEADPLDLVTGYADETHSKFGTSRSPDTFWMSI